ncbi:MAG: hypothetical protein Aurels2KO_49250 [Aureliella sp.]
MTSADQKRIGHEPIRCRLALETLESRLLLSADMQFGYMNNFDYGVEPHNSVASMHAEYSALRIRPAEGESESSTQDHAVRYEVIAVDSEGLPLQEVSVGEEFWIRVYVKDVRQQATELGGLFSAYTRLHLDGADIEVTGDAIIGDDFSVLRYGNVGSDRLVGFVGGVVESWEQKIEEALLFEVPARATSVGSVAIQTGNSGSTFLTDTLLLGSDQALRNESIDFGSLDLPVIQPPADALPTQPFLPSEDGDGFVSGPPIREPQERFVSLHNGIPGIKRDTALLLRDLPTRSTKAVAPRYRQSAEPKLPQEQSIEREPAGVVPRHDESPEPALAEEPKTARNDAIDRLLQHLDSMADGVETAHVNPLDFALTFRRSAMSRIALRSFDDWHGTDDSERSRIRQVLGAFAEADSRYLPNWSERAEDLYKSEDVDHILAEQHNPREQLARTQLRFRDGYNRAVIRASSESVDRCLVELFSRELLYLGFGKSGRSRQTVNTLPSDELEFTPLLDRLPPSQDRLVSSVDALPSEASSLQRPMMLWGIAVLFVFPLFLFRRSRPAPNSNPNRDD